jgi:hypothetical protein
MADIYLTEKDDTYDHTKDKPWTTIRALGGNDFITIHGNGTVLGGPGNDVITNDVFDNPSGSVAYWDSPNAIYVDLEAGYALDGYGTRDTLVNIRDVSTSGRDGDMVFGTSKSDSVSVNGFNWTSRQYGAATLDLRGGIDTVTFYDNKPSDIQMDVSADGRVVKLVGKNGYTATVKNAEIFRFVENLSNGSQLTSQFNVTDLIDLQNVGSSLLTRGYKGWQTGVVGNAVTLTYSFLSQVPSSGSEGGTGFSVFNAEQKQTIRDLLYLLQNQTGLAFSEVSGDVGQIRFGINQQINTRAYSYIPDEFKNDARAGDVWIDQETSLLMSPGQEGYYVLLHELAHGLGLQHPLTESDSSGATVLLNAFATTSNTVMLDVAASTTNGLWPTWFGSFDLQALRTLYGFKAYATGNNVYGITDKSNSLTIVDDGGVDSLDASSSSVSAYIDLRSGKTSSIGMDADGTAKFSNVSIASGSLIENVTGTAYDDVIVGNAENNVINFIGGNDIVDGQAGMDTIRIANKAAEFNVSKDIRTGNWNVEALNNVTGSIELQNMERIYFADKAWALDMGTNENAGRTAKILGALFGKEGLGYPSFRGIGLYFLDAGYSYEALMGAAVDTRLWPGASKADVAKVLMGNVPGLVVDPNAYANTTAMAVAAADSDLNKVMINLVGLATSGFDYIILG